MLVNSTAASPHPCSRTCNLPHTQMCTIQAVATVSADAWQARAWRSESATELRSAPADFRYAASPRSLALRFRSKPAQPAQPVFLLCCRRLHCLNNVCVFIRATDGPVVLSAKAALKCSGGRGYGRPCAIRLKALEVTAGGEDDAIGVRRRQLLQAERRDVATRVAEQTLRARCLCQLWVPTELW